MEPILLWVPEYSNCLIWAWVHYRTYGGYIAMRKSYFYPGPHFIWSLDLKVWYGYRPVNPSKKLFPPPLFEGAVYCEI